MSDDKDRCPVPTLSRFCVKRCRDLHVKSYYLLCKVCARSKCRSRVLRCELRARLKIFRDVRFAESFAAGFSKVFREDVWFLSFYVSVCL